MAYTSYRTGQVATILDKSTSSIRKWAAAVEQAGATFMRDDKGERLFSDADLAAFQSMKKALAAGRTTAQAAQDAAALLNSQREVMAQEGDVLALNDRELMRNMAVELTELRELTEKQALEQYETNRRLSAIMATLKRLEAPAEPTPHEDVVPSQPADPAPKTSWWARLFKN